jgi:hypothetical protein
VIVVISDLHLTDGTSGTQVEAGAFSLFARLVGDMARHASHRGERFHLLEEGLDLVLLGDILDLLRSPVWPQRSSPGERVPRPWLPAEEIASTVGQIVDRILDRNADGLAVLRRLREEGATFHEGRTFRVPVRINYFVGNHDWMLRLPGSVYDGIRWRVAKAMGLANDPTRPFPHSMIEASPDLAGRIREHRLVLRHGDVYDRAAFTGDRNVSSLGDGVVIELLNRFPETVRQELKLELDAPLYLALREIDNVRPFTLIPFWVLGVMRKFGLEGKPAGRTIVDVWSRLVEQFFALDFVRSRDRAWRWDEVDELQIKFRLLKRFFSGKVQRALVGTVMGLVPDVHRKYPRHALAETEIQSGEASYVAYGHTHEHAIRPLAVRREGASSGTASPCESAIPTNARESPASPSIKQYYFNSGTWRPFYRQTLAHPERLEFLGFHNLTVLAFYHADERGGRGFEVWNGALAGPP